MCSFLIFSFPTFYSVVGVGFTLDSACSIWALVSVSIGVSGSGGFGPLGSELEMGGPPFG